ncbi:MAG: transporter substrate-binding domain-containing protein [Desulfobacterales bacterium]|nr:transporter substrate-binding domain-containing protein [Desulfobacterales bacterium]MBF0397257.1 transporter substrate-binding domain-containing protein [Desulfobacterales bacterium]
MKRLLFILIFINIISIAEGKDIKLSCDARYWYPFVYTEGALIKGMHIDIVTKALKNLGYNAHINALPRKRSILSAESGDVDGIISITYHPNHAKSLEYPEGANVDKESKFRIMQVDLMIISHIDNNYEFEGDIKSIPAPIRITRGETIADDLKNQGLEVEETTSDEQNFSKLIRDKKGTVITTSVIAESMNKDKRFTSKFKISSTPLISQSYYLAFSVKTKLSSSGKKNIWEEISRLRDDYVYMLQVFAQY